MISIPHFLLFFKLKPYIYNKRHLQFYPYFTAPRAIKPSHRLQDDAKHRGSPEGYALWRCLRKTKYAQKIPYNPDVVKVIFSIFSTNGYS